MSASSRQQKLCDRISGIRMHWPGNNASEGSHRRDGLRNPGDRGLRTVRWINTTGISAQHDEPIRHGGQGSGFISALLARQYSSFKVKTFLVFEKICDWFVQIQNVSENIAFTSAFMKRWNWIRLKIEMSHPPPCRVD